MKFFLPLILIGSFFSCNNKEATQRKNLDKNLFKFFSENLKSIDSTLHLDSVRIIKFDTITKTSILYQKILSIYLEVDDNNDKFKEIKKTQNLDAQMIRLTAGLSNSLYENSMDDYKQKNEEMKALHNVGLVLLKKADSLTDILKTADSTTLVYFQVKCLIQYQRKDLSVKRDTAFAFLNPERNIVRRTDVFQ